MKEIFFDQEEYKWVRHKPLPHPKKMCNVDIFIGAILKRAIIDWLVYHDVVQGVGRSWFLSADEYIRYGDFDTVAKCSRQRLLRMLQERYEEGGYSSVTFERALMQNEDLRYLV